MNKRILWIVLAALLLVTMAAAAVLPGTLAYLAAGSNTVRNSFSVGDMPAEPTSVEIGVQKRVVCEGKGKIGPGGFEFLLRDREHGTIHTMTTDKNGRASLTLPFTAEDAGKRYTFELSEINNGVGGVTYDSRVYVIGIALSVDEQNRMTAALTLDGQATDAVIAAFRNVYAPAELPKTGDESRLMLHALMLLLSGAGLALLARRGGGRTARRPQ